MEPVSGADGEGEADHAEVALESGEDYDRFGT